MTLQEAIRSGRKFTRKNHIWEDPFCGPQDDYNTIRLTQVDILADDWEVEEEKRELSWNELSKAIDDSVYAYCMLNIEDFKHDVRKHLGFKE